VKPNKLKIFCDFDGTVTKNDVWVHSLGKFIKDREKFSRVCEEFDNLLISSRECIRRELDLVEDFTFEKFNEEVDKEKLDDYFHEFISYCSKNNYDLFLISEGLDYYIERILKREGLEHLKLYSNKMTYLTDEQGKIKLSCEFPYSDEVCNYCGMSKRNVILANTNDYENEISVLIGDGTSDFCAADYADIVFAKRKLASYCWKNNITYFEYDNFSDIISKIEKLKEKKQLKQRQTARFLRRDVFIGG
jgi:2,3-diketo-5-methylthio-1-phosphopentane phosphatase